MVDGECVSVAGFGFDAAFVYLVGWSKRLAWTFRSITLSTSSSSNLCARLDDGTNAGTSSSDELVDDRFGGNVERCGMADNAIIRGVLRLATGALIVLSKSRSSRLTAFDSYGSGFVKSYAGVSFL